MRDICVAYLIGCDRINDACPRDQYNHKGSEKEFGSNHILSPDLYLYLVIVTSAAAVGRMQAQL
jgi:hypothetical protein